MDPAPEQVAPRFKVMIETKARIGGFGGWLTVYQGLLVLTPTRPSQRFGLAPRQQSTRHLSWIRQPLFPPWLNRAIDFVPDGEHDVIRLRLGFTARKQLRATLEAAGFEIADVTSRSILFGP